MTCLTFQSPKLSKKSTSIIFRQVQILLKQTLLTGNGFHKVTMDSRSTCLKSIKQQQCLQEKLLTEFHKKLMILVSDVGVLLLAQSALLIGRQVFLQESMMPLLGM